MGFLLVGIVLVTLFTITRIPLSALAAPIKLNYAGFGPPKAFPCLQAERWKEIVEEKVPGKVAIKTFPAETLLSAKNIMDGVIQGQADIGVLCTAYQPGRFFVTKVAILPPGVP
jgi:TRAP-type C4-dicarboxylate transport system substrate-binding protein